MKGRYFNLWTKIISAKTLYLLLVFSWNNKWFRYPLYSLYSFFSLYFVRHHSILNIVCAHDDFLLMIIISVWYIRDYVCERIFHKKLSQIGRKRLCQNLSFIRAFESIKLLNTYLFDVFEYLYRSIASIAHINLFLMNIK